MEKIKYDDVDSVNQLTKTIIKLNKEFEPNLTAKEAINRYESFLADVREQFNSEKDKVPGKYFVLAVEDYILCCTIARFFHNIGATLIYTCVEQAKQIDLDHYCAGIIEFANQMIEKGEWIVSTEVRVIEDKEEFIRLEKDENENNIRYH